MTLGCRIYLYTSLAIPEDTIRGLQRESRLGAESRSTKGLLISGPHLIRPTKRRNGLSSFRVANELGQSNMTCFFALGADHVISGRAAVSGRLRLPLKCSQAFWF